MHDEVFEEKLRENVKMKNLYITKVYGDKELDVEEILREYREYAKKIKPFVKETSVEVYDNIKGGYHHESGAVFLYCRQSHGLSGGGSYGEATGAGGLSPSAGDGGVDAGTRRTVLCDAQRLVADRVPAAPRTAQRLYDDRRPQRQSCLQGQGER